MTHSEHILRLDRCSYLAVVGALASLSLALVLGARPVPGAIPDGFLDRIRGLNPNTVQQNEGSCTVINVNNLNLFDPPQGPDTAVAWNNCILGLNNVTICICGATLNLTPLATLNLTPLLYA